MQCCLLMRPRKIWKSRSKILSLRSNSKWDRDSLEQGACAGNRDWFQLILTLENLLVQLEAGVEEKTVPLILLECSLGAEVRDWAGLMSATASLKLQLASYNELYNVWEPLIEPVEKDGAQQPWELTVTVRCCRFQSQSLRPQCKRVLFQAQKNSDLDLSEDEDELKTLPPKMSVTLIATDMLQLTVTKTCIQMLTTLGDVWNGAVSFDY